MVHNLESPGLSGGIDSTVNNRISDQVKIIFSGFFVSFLVMV